MFRRTSPGPPAPADAPARPWTGGARRRRWPRWVLVAAVVLVGLGVLVALVQPLRVRAVAAATVADALDLPIVRPFAPTPPPVRTTVGGVEGDLYDPGPDAPGVVLLPGAVPDGTEDPRIVALARAVAGADRAVFVPVLEVYEQRLVPDDVDRIVAAAEALADAERGRVSIVGASFGGSLGLLAAADDRLKGRLAIVATFGAYTDLVGVLQAAMTGTALVDGRRVDWPADPRAHDVVVEQVLELVPADQRARVRRAVDGAVDPATLPTPLRAVHDLLDHDDPDETFLLAERLPDEMRERLAEVSPLTVADRIEAPVVAMHSVEDPTIPYGEMLRLGEAIGHARLITLSRFDHVGIELDSPRTWAGGVADLTRAWRFTTAVLDAQESGVPPRPSARSWNEPLPRSAPGTYGHGPRDREVRAW